MDLIGDRPARRRGEANRAPAYSRGVSRQIRTLPAISAFLLLVSLALLAFATQSAHAGPSSLPKGWKSEDILGNAGIATDFVFLPDDRLLVILKAGRILMVKGNKVTGIAADLTSLVGRAYGDRGVVAAAVHPEFGTDAGKDWIYIGYVWDGTKEVAERMFGDVSATWGGNPFVVPGGFRRGIASRFVGLGSQDTNAELLCYLELTPILSS
jgi:hypothetical protein